MNYNVIHNCNDREPKPATDEAEIIVKLSDQRMVYARYPDQPVINAAGPLFPIRFCPFCGIDLVEERKKVE